MSIYESAVKKPVTTILIFVAIAIFGLFSLSRLSIDLYPKIETSNIMVVTSYAGASASDIENNVTKVLENTLNGVSNLKHITSKSRENASVITLQFNEGVDIEVATNDVRDKLDAVSNFLPDDVNKPMIFKFGTDDIPITMLSVQAKESTMALSKILEDKVTNALARLDGVGAVSIMGTVKREIQVYCDPAKLEAYNLTVEAVSQIISAENKNVPAGLIDLGNKTSSIRIQGEFADARQLNQIVVASVGGRNVYLSDVARVEDTHAENEQESYNNNVRGAMIMINKQSGANSVAISRAVRDALPEIQASLPSDVKLGTIFDTSDNIVNTINSLRDTIAITFVIVILVVLFFLGRWRATFIIGLTIPISLVASFIYLMATGNTLNIISLSSLSIAIGMVVDDAIVVLENVTTHIERGSYPKQAAIHGTNEVGISVIASTLTMLAVFLPLTMIQGLTGILFRQLGWIVSIIMIISTVAALSLTPMLCSQLLQRDKKQGRLQQKLFVPIERFLDSVDRVYERFLNWTVRHRTVTIVSAFIIFAASLMMTPLLKTEFFPQSDNGYIQIQAEYPVGTGVNLPRAFALRMIDSWEKEIPEIDRTSFSVGQAEASSMFAAMQDNGTNIITFHIGLTGRNERKRSMNEVADQIRTMLDDYPEIHSYKVTPGGSGGGMGGQPTVNLDIYGYDFNKTGDLAERFSRLMKEDARCAQATISRKDYVPEYQFVFDRTKLAENGLNSTTAAMFLRNRVNGRVASTYREEGDEYDIRVRLAPEFRRSLRDLENILIYTPQGKGVRLGELGKIEELYTPPTIERKDRQRVVIVASTAVKGAALSDLVEVAKEKIAQLEIPDGIDYKISGTYEDQQKTFADLSTLMLLIVILVFIVMAAQFESLVDPFVIMFSIPFAFTGVIVGLIITNTTFSAMSFIGLIMLMGIVVKNGIVLIDYTRLCRERGMGILSAVVQAGRSRLRPVLMTTLTTILGMVPMAIGIGEGSELWQPMGVTVAWGLSVSTLITLIIVPTVYAVFASNGMRRQRRLLAKKYAKKENKSRVWNRK